MLHSHYHAITALQAHSLPEQYTSASQMMQAVVHVAEQYSAHIMLSCSLLQCLL